MTEVLSIDDPRSRTERMRTGDLYGADDPEIFEADAGLDVELGRE